MKLLRLLPWMSLTKPGANAASTQQSLLQSPDSAPRREVPQAGLEPPAPTSQPAKVISANLSCWEAMSATGVPSIDSGGHLEMVPCKLSSPWLLETKLALCPCQTKLQPARTHEAPWILGVWRWLLPGYCRPALPAAL